MRLLAKLLTESATRYPDRIALITDDLELSYKDLLKHALSLKDTLKELGCEHGICIGIMLPNSLEYAVSFFATLMADCTAVPISFGSTDFEIAKYIERSGISVLITNQSKILNANTNAKILNVAVQSSELVIKQSDKSFDIIPNEDVEDVALLLATSGSTGESKFVMLKSENLIENIRAYKEAMNFKGIHRIYCILPMNHIYCIAAQLLTHISRGDQIIIGRSPFMVSSFLKCIQNKRITGTAFVPYMTRLLTNARGLENYDVSSLSFVLIGGAKASAEIIRSLCKSFPSTRFLPTYALTEASPRVAIVRPDDQNFPPESSGKALPDVSIKIDNTTSSGQIGEVLVCSKSVMKGYFNNPKATSETICNNWLRTGDLGYIDENSYLYIVGRKKHLIISGGTNIYPSEVEECLRRHRDVIDVVVVGMRHELLQEVPCAILETKKKDIDALSEVLRKHCLNELSLYKIPYSFISVESIPRLSNSKVNYEALKKIIKS